MNDIKSHDTSQSNSVLIHPEQKNYKLMNTLDQAFKKRNNKNLSSNPTIPNRANKNLAILRKIQLNQWKSARNNNTKMADFIAMRRAQQKSIEKKQLIKLGQPSFKEKRKKQLKLWREKGSWQSR